MAPGKMKALGSPDLYTIGWIAALHIERAAAAAMLDEEHAQPDGFSRNANDKNSYTWGRIGDHNIVIASLKAGVHGLVSAGATASSLLSSLPSIRLGLLVGIGGGIPRPDGGYDIRLGDVIVSQPDGTTGGVCQYDFVKAKPGNRRERKGFLVPPPDVLLHAVANIQSAHERRDSEIPNILEEMQRQNPKMAKKTKQSPGYVHQGFANDRLFQSSYEHVSSRHDGCQSCEAAEEVERDERESMDPEIHYGIIASGNTLVNEGVARDRIVAEVGEECICFEMEAAGLMNEFPCLVIRGVCDYADSHKNDQWQRYASATAAAYAKELLAYVPEADVQESKRASEILQMVDQKLENVQQASQAVDAKVESIILGVRGKKLRKWLAAPDPTTNANHARELRHEGTGTWLLEASTFQEWMSGTNRHLWLRGMAGCGKTVLTTTVLDHLSKTNDRMILSFFFDFGDTTKQTKDSLLRSMALQLYQGGCSSVAAHLDDSFSAHQDGDLKPTTAFLEETVDQLLTAQQKVTILLDALDESTTRDQIISWIERMHENLSFVQMFYTSREEAEFIRAFPNMNKKEYCLSIDKGGVDEDIVSYVSARLQSQSEFTEKALSGDVLDRIRDKVGNGANGMFRWATCQLDSLAKSTSLYELEQQLNSLPLDLPDTYRRMLDSIPRKNRESAMRLLQFLTFSKRPLTLQEGVEIIATEIQGKQPCFKPERRLFNKNDILRHCPSLVSLIDAKRGIKTIQELHLAHFSVKEYLLVHVPIFKPLDASIAITRTLITYLGDIGGLFSELRKNFPLASYAAEAWVEFAHIAGASEDIPTTIVSFLRRKETFMRWSCLNGTNTRGSYFYHACVAGLEAVVASIIDQGIDINDEPDGYYGKPLQAASYHGHLDIVRLLILAGADVDARGGYFRNALQAACFEGHTEITKLLIEHDADIDAVGGGYGTALETACDGGYFDLVRLLLEKGADVRPQSETIGALMVACSKVSDRVDIVQLLLDHGAGVCVNGGSYGNPLQAAAFNCHKKIITLLLDRGVDVNALGGKYGSALQAACGADVPDIEVVELLIDRGADLNAQGGKWGSPLQAAYYRDEEAVFHFLIASGADVKVFNTSDIESLLRSAINSRSASQFRMLASLEEDFRLNANVLTNLLQHACREQFEKGIEALLNIGAEINAWGGKYGSALHAACVDDGFGYDDVKTVRFLLESGADVNTKHDKRGDILQLACSRGRRSMVDMLITFGADVNAHGPRGTTAMHCASRKGDESIVSTLLKQEASINTTDVYGRTPLHEASWGGNVETVAILLKNGSDIEAKDNQGRTPLHQASLEGYGQVVKLLLEEGSNPKSTDNDGQTPLHLASQGGYAQVAELLIRNGANIESTTNDGQTPLHIASQKGRKWLVEVLVENGANIKPTDIDGHTPLYLATWEGHKEVAKLLIKNGANSEDR